MRAIIQKVMPYAGLAVLTVGSFIFFNRNKVDHAEDTDAIPAAYEASDIQKFSPDELSTLVAPIALYPDVLLAQVFPASTYSTQIVEANRFIEQGGNADQPPSDAAWDGSVVALLHYPTVLKKMNDDLRWTEQLGVAVTYQMDELTQAIQESRGDAVSIGNLRSSDQYIVETSDDVIQILPTNSEVIYVPEYDPYEIYETRMDSPFIWGTGYSYGVWMGYSWDWQRHRIWSNNRWDRGSWHRSSRSEWNAPRRSVPSWYTRSGSNNFNNNRVSPRAFSNSGRTTGTGGASRSGSFRNGSGRNGSGRSQATPQTIAPDPSSRIQRTPRTDTQTPQATLQTTPGASRRSGWDRDDSRNRGSQSTIDSQRGQFSRGTRQAPATPQVAPQVIAPQVTAPRVERSIPRPERSMPRMDHTPQVAPRVSAPTPAPAAPRAPAPSLHENRPADRGATQRESSRGAASRATVAPSIGGGGGHGTSPGGNKDQRGGKH